MENKTENTAFKSNFLSLNGKNMSFAADSSVSPLKMGNKTENTAFKSNFFSLNDKNMSFAADLSVI